MARETYEAQVALLVRVLPHVAGESVFAGAGTWPAARSADVVRSSAEPIPESSLEVGERLRVGSAPVSELLRLAVAAHPELLGIGAVRLARGPVCR